MFTSALFVTSSSHLVQFYHLTGGYVFIINRSRSCAHCNSTNMQQQVWCARQESLFQFVVMHFEPCSWEAIGWFIVGFLARYDVTATAVKSGLDNKMYG